MRLGNIKGDKIQFHFGVENSALLTYQKHINTLMVLFKQVSILPNAPPPPPKKNQMKKINAIMKLISVSNSTMF